MNKVLRFLRANWAFLVWPVVGLLLFLPCLGLYTVLPSPDSAPTYRPSEQLAIFEELLGDALSVAPHDLFRLLLPPLFLHDLSYLVDTLLIAAGLFWFQRGRKVPTLPALLSAGALAFAGYSFTLVSAGHRGYFFMGPYMVFTFAFLVHAIDRRRPLFFALAGCCAAWVVRFGPDVAPLFLAIAALYALFLLFTAHREEALPRRIRPFLLGCLCAAAAFGLTAAPSIYHTFTDLVAHRKGQIAESSPSAAATNGTAPASADTKADAEREKWIFATNWSLPPEETIELVAPAIYGRDSGSRDAPYWGRLGRTEGWEQHHQGFFNFRQHIVYLGSIPVALAVFAALAYFTRRRRLAATNPDGDTAAAAPYVRDIPFWAAVGVVALLLAFGRYAPFYRAFYSLPYMSLLRAPVKFVRVVELATAVLAGSGLTLLLTLPKGDILRKVLAVGLGASALACGAYAFSIHSSPGSFAAILGQLGAGQLIPSAASNAVAALWHPILGFGLVALAAWLLDRGRLAPRPAASILLIALAMDAYLVARPFMGTIDIRKAYEPNAITKIATEASPDAPVFTDLRQTPQQPYWMSTLPPIHRLRRQTLADRDIVAYLQASGGDLVRLLEITGSSCAVVPPRIAQSIPRGRCEPIGWYNLSEAGMSPVMRPTESSVLLVKAPGALPFARLYSSWIHSAGPDWIPAIVREMRTGRDDVVVVDKKGLPEPTASAEPGTVEVKSVRLLGNSLKTRILTRSPSPQVLAVRMGYQPWEVATIDGKPAEVFHAGFYGIGVLVPEGEHVVTISRRRRPFVFSLSVLVAVLFLAGAGAAVFRRKC